MTRCWDADLGGDTGDVNDPATAQQLVFSQRFVAAGDTVTEVPTPSTRPHQGSPVSTRDDQGDGLIGPSP